LCSPISFSQAAFREATLRGMPELEAQAFAAMRALSRVNPLTPELIRKSYHDLGLEAWSERRAAKAILSLASRFRTRGNFGKLRAAVLSGITWYGEEFLREVERAGVLLADRAGGQGVVFTRFLVDLKDETEGIDEVAWQRLDRRLKAYVAYQELSHALTATAARASRFVAKPATLTGENGAGCNCHFRRPLADREGIDDLPAGLSMLAGMTRAAHAPLRPQMVHQLFFQCAPGLNEQTAVNRFVGHAQALVSGILDLQPTGNLLRRPVQHQFTRNELPQLQVDGQQAALGPQG
jgi:hypothetical protein